MINATTGHGNNDLPFKHLDLINGLVTTTRNILALLNFEWVKRHAD